MATLRFSSFVVDLHRHALMRDGTRVPMSTRLVKILGHLASNPGALISKNTMLDRFWPDAHVTENTVDRTIARIRKALDDDAGRPTFIQTISGEGYRFIAAVDTSGAPPLRDAFDEWMKGRLSLESLNAVQLHDATAAFERVLACDATYPPAQTALANAYFLQLNALVGLGYAHLAAHDPAAAADAFGRGLDLFPSNGRALFGLQQASARGGQAMEEESLTSRIHSCLEELARGGRVAEAALLQASMAAERGDIESALATIQQMLERAVSGQVGWMVPIDPALRPLHDHGSFKSVLTLLCSRAS